MYKKTKPECEAQSYPIDGPVRSLGITYVQLAEAWKELISETTPQDLYHIFEVAPNDLGEQIFNHLLTEYSETLYDFLNEADGIYVLVYHVGLVSPETLLNLVGSEMAEQIMTVPPRI